MPDKNDDQDTKPEEEQAEKKAHLRDPEAEEVNGGSTMSPPDSRMTLGSVQFEEPR